PKWMLRAKQVVSPLADFTGGRFRPVIDDPRFREVDTPVNQVRKVLLCCGKLYWEMAAAIEKRGLTDVALVRLEQLYPVPDRRLAAVLDRYPNAEDVRWVQEEPGNQGAWPFLGLVLPAKMPRLVGIKRVSRRAMAAPAVGSSKVYATDRGIEELAERRGDEQVSVEWLAERLRVFVDRNPAFEDAVERLASFLARDDEE